MCTAAQLRSPIDRLTFVRNVNLIFYMNVIIFETLSHLYLEIEANDRILSLRHVEQEWRFNAQIW